MRLGDRNTASAALLQSACSASTDDWTNRSSANTSLTQSYAIEDRFIGVADYSGFFHNPCSVNVGASGSLTEARYRKTLELRMGLGGGSGLMQFPSGHHNPSCLSSDAGEGGDCFSFLGVLERGEEDLVETCDELREQQCLPLGAMTEVAHELRDGFYTPPSSPRRGRLEYPPMYFPTRQKASSVLSTPQPTSVVCIESNECCHTPTKRLRGLTSVYQGNRTPGGIGEASGNSYNCSQRGDTRLGTPVAASAGMRTPVPASRCSEVSGSCTTSPQLGRTFAHHLLVTPQLRTPVRHENDLLSAQTTGGPTGSLAASQNVSPASRRSLFFLHHTTPRCHGKTCDRVLTAEGLSLSDIHGRENFSPLCWSYMGAIIALKQSVYLWQGAGRTHLLFGAPAQCGLVTAVASSRRPTETGNVYTAIGMQNGMIMLLNNHVVDNALFWDDAIHSGPVDVDFNKTKRAMLMAHTTHVSTVHIVGHLLYAGCMNGVLTVHNLYNSSIDWKDASYYYDVDICSCLSHQIDSRVNVGAPIYKLEVTPDQQHIAVGTERSLFVYQTSRMGLERRRRRRVVVSGASRPVRAFCWWALPFNTSVDFASDTYHSCKSFSKYDFGHTVLLYAGGSEGSVLSVYSVGSRCKRATCPLSAPILAILSSETSEEILVSVDVTSGTEGGERERGTASVRDENTGNDGNDVGGRFHNHNDNNTNTNTNDDRWPLYDLSSEDEGFSHVLYVDRHLPVSIGGLNTNITNSGGALGISRGRAQQLLPDGEAMRVRPPLPHSYPSHESTQDAELLQLFQLKDGGATWERLGGFSGPQKASMYMALSPDNSLLCTAGGELKMRIWRAFKTRRPERALRCELR